MKLVTNFLLYLLPGFAAALIVSRAFRKKIPVACRFFFWLATISAVLTTAITVLSLAGDHPFKPGPVINGLLVWLGRLTLLLTGFCLGDILVRPADPGTAADKLHHKADFSWFYRGLAISLGLIFVVTMIEQIHEMHSIQKFFIDAGYPAGFAWFITMLEGLCGLGLLLKLPFYPKLATMIVLTAVMIGAMISHFKKGDPVNYALAAIQYTIKLFILLIAYLFYQSRKNSSI